MGDTLRVLRYAMVVAFADYAAMYTWKTWLGAWLSRVLAQVAFYALVGRLLGDPATVRYLLIGSAVWIAAMEVCFAIASTAWERRAGTLPLLVIAPTDPFVVFVGRSVMWIVSGVTTATLSLVLLTPVFRVALAPARVVAVIPLILLTALGTYGVAMVAAGFAMRMHGARNVIANVLNLVMLIFCGVQVPLTYWPSWVREVSNAVPLTHGLGATRIVLDAGPAARLWTQVGLAAATGIAWFGVAWLVFRGAAERGRRTGSIEFGE